MRITNLQKKELSDIFKDVGLNTSDFEPSGLYNDFKIQYKYEYYSFSLNCQKIDNYYLTIFPIDNTKGFSVVDTWAQTKKRFTNWAKGIATELTTATGWETFKNENYLHTDINDLNEPFSETDKILARKGIEELKESITKLELPLDTINTINKKLDELTDKVDHLSKFDWKSLLIGTIASLILTFTIPPEFSGSIWEYVRLAFSSFRLSK